MKLSEEWITGFVDGEGCFHVGVNPHREMTSGFQVLPEFTVVQHKRDISLLFALKEFFGCGVVRRNNGDRMAFRVRSIRDLRERIVPFFAKYPLQSGKRFDFQLFVEILKMMSGGRHLTKCGIQVIHRIASKMNRGRLRESPAYLETDRVDRAKFLVG